MINQNKYRSMSNKNIRNPEYQKTKKKKITIKLRIKDHQRLERVKKITKYNFRLKKMISNRVRIIHQKLCH